jgi:hypothetical protein
VAELKTVWISVVKSNPDKRVCSLAYLFEQSLQSFIRDLASDLSLLTHPHQHFRHLLTHLRSRQRYSRHWIVSRNHRSVGGSDSHLSLASGSSMALIIPRFISS